MKSLKVLLASLTLFCSQAFAIPTTWTDTYDPSPDIMIPPSLTFTLDITEGPNGFRPGIDSISLFWLEVYLRDDGDAGRETALIDLPGVLGDRTPTSSILFNIFLPSISGSIAGWIDLALSGELSVTISSVTGDFFFNSATLYAVGNQAEPDNNQVPEPGNMLLLGAALTAAALANRRRKL